MKISNPYRNSLESGNNVLKTFKAVNMKGFLGKMREFIEEWSKVERTFFPLQVEYKEILNGGEKLAKEENLFIPRINRMCSTVLKKESSLIDALKLALEQLKPPDSSSKYRRIVRWMVQL